MIVFVVVLVFAWAIHPLVQRDYYETFLGMVSATSRAEAEQGVERISAALAELDRSIKEG